MWTSQVTGRDCHWTATPSRDDAKPNWGEPLFTCPKDRVVLLAFFLALLLIPNLLTVLAVLVLLPAQRSPLHRSPSTQLSTKAKLTSSHSSFSPPSSLPPSPPLVDCLSPVSSQQLPAHLLPPASPSLIPLRPFSIPSTPSIYPAQCVRSYVCPPRPSSVRRRVVGWHLFCSGPHRFFDQLILVLTACLLRFIGSPPNRPVCKCQYMLRMIAPKGLDWCLVD